MDVRVVDHPLAAARLTTLRDERQDLLQDICFAIWRALPRLRGESPEVPPRLSRRHNRAIRTQRGRASSTHVASLHVASED